MARALDVAKFLIHLAVAGDEPDPLTHLRLQKLLYYVQGWHLAAFGKPMFPEQIQAWVNGPVVADVWPRFKEYGYACILPRAEEPPPSLSPRDRTFIKSIWDRYNVYSPTRLAQMTHDEAPWRRARGDLPAWERSNEPITHECMRAHFAPLLESRLPKGITLDQLVRAENQVEQGEFQTHQQLKSLMTERRNAL